MRSPQSTRCIVLILSFYLVILNITMGNETSSSVMVWQPIKFPGNGCPILSIAHHPFRSNIMLVGGYYFGIRRSEDWGETWKEVQGLTCPMVNSITWDKREPSRVWAATLMGPFVSFDAGKTWEPKRFGMPQPEVWGFSAPITDIIVDPVVPGRILAFGGSRLPILHPGNPGQNLVWESLDYGESWITLSAIQTEDKVQPVQIRKGSIAPELPEFLYVITHQHGIFRSVDSGKTWNSIQEGLPHTKISDLVFHPKNPNLLVISLEATSSPESSHSILPGGIYISNSGGLRWFPIHQSLPIKQKKSLHLTTSFSFVTIDPFNHQRLFTVDSAWDQGTLYTTANWGQTWERLVSLPPLFSEKFIPQESNPSKDPEPSNTPPTPFSTESLRAFPAGFLIHSFTIVQQQEQSYFYAGTDESLLFSNNYGKTWKDLSAKICMNEKNEIRWEGNGLSGLLATQIIFSPFRENDLCILGDNSGMGWYSSDQGIQWVPIGRSFWPWAGAFTISWPTENQIWMGTGSFNRGGAILSIFLDQYPPKEESFYGSRFQLPNPQGCSVSSLYIPPRQKEHIWAVISGDLYYSSDGGKTWSVSLRRVQLGIIAPHHRDPYSFYISGKRNCYLIKEGRDVVPIGGPRSTGPAICDSLGRLYIVASDTMKPGLWRYEQQKWTRLLNEPFISNVAIDPKNPRRIAITTLDIPNHDNLQHSGVWLSQDDGITWTQWNEGLPYANGRAIAFNPWNPEYLYFGTWGHGIYRLHWPLDYKLEGTRSYPSSVADQEFCQVIREGRVPNQLPTATPTGTPSPPTTPPETRSLDETQFYAGPLRNGNMEEGGLLPNFWTSKWVGSGTIEIRRDVTVAQSGQASLLIEAIGESKGQISQIMDIGTIQKVRVKGFLKTNISQGSVKVAIQSFGPNWHTLQFKVVKHQGGISDWTEFQGETTIPPGTQKFGIAMLIEGIGKAWLDNVELWVQ